MSLRGVEQIDQNINSLAALRPHNSEASPIHLPWKLTIACGARCRRNEKSVAAREWGGEMEKKRNRGNRSFERGRIRARTKNGGEDQARTRPLACVCPLEKGTSKKKLKKIEGPARRNCATRTDGHTSPAASYRAARPLLDGWPRKRRSKSCFNSARKSRVSAERIRRGARIVSPRNSFRPRPNKQGLGSCRKVDSY